MNSFTTRGWRAPWSSGSVKSVAQQAVARVVRRTNQEARSVPDVKMAASGAKKVIGQGGVKASFGDTKRHGKSRGKGRDKGRGKGRGVASN